MKAKIYYTSFPVASPYNKLARAKVRCVCCVVSFPNAPLQRLVVANLQQVRNKLASSPSTGKLRRNVCNGFWALHCCRVNRNYKGSIYNNCLSWTWTLLKYATDAKGYGRGRLKMSTWCISARRISQCKALSTLATIVAEFGDCNRKRRQIVAEFGDYSRQCRQGLKVQVLPQSVSSSMGSGQSPVDKSIFSTPM